MIVEYPRGDQRPLASSLNQAIVPFLISSVVDGIYFTSEPNHTQTQEGYGSFRTRFKYPVNHNESNTLVTFHLFTGVNISRYICDACFGCASTVLGDTRADANVDLIIIHTTRGKLI